VLDSYKDLSERTARAKKNEMQSLGRKGVPLKETLQHLQEAFSSETPPESADFQGCIRLLALNCRRSR